METVTYNKLLDSFYDFLKQDLNTGSAIIINEKAIFTLISLNGVYREKNEQERKKAYEIWKKRDVKYLLDYELTRFAEFYEPITLSSEEREGVIDFLVNYMEEWRKERNGE